MTFRSPLHDEHVRLGARMTDFAGWQMPLQYEGVLAEHRAVRERAGVFDVSHLGKLIVRGPDAIDVLDRLLPGKVASLREWTAGYNLVLTPEGGIIDDIFVYRRPEFVVLVPNAANTSVVADALSAGANGEIEIEDARDRWAIIALQGPASRTVADEVAPEANSLGMHRFTDLEVAGVRVQVARTGYTGEYGFELFVPAEKAPDIWSAVMKAGGDHGIAPAGLGARDTLRLEMGYPLHGHEISTDTNPIEAALEWVIDWSKPRFVAKQRLEEVRAEGPSRRLVGLVAPGREIPRAGYRILSGPDGVGAVTSGNFSPVLGRGIALGYVSAGVAEEGTMLSVEIRGRIVPVEVTKPPFIKHRRG